MGRHMYARELTSLLFIEFYFVLWNPTILHVQT